jgi:hypothetical protein
MGNDAKQAYLDIVRRLTPDQIDEGLEAISRPHVRAVALALASTLGSTARRRRLLAEDLEVLLRGGHTSSLAAAIDNLWCREIADAVVKLFALGEWAEEDGMQRHRELIDVVARRMTRDVAQEVVGPAIAAATVPDAERVLRLWYDLGVRRRE